MFQRYLGASMVFSFALPSLSCDAQIGWWTGNETKKKMADEIDESGKQKTKLDTSLLKGFVAGVVFSHINKRLILGFLVGTLAGAYIQQNYEGVPVVEETAKEWLENIRSALNKKGNRKDWRQIWIRIRLFKTRWWQRLTNSTRWAIWNERRRKFAITFTVTPDFHSLWRVWVWLGSSSLRNLVRSLSWWSVNRS